MAKLYRSEVWLRRRYKIQRKTIAEIAAECGVSSMTISRYLREFNLI